MSRRTVHAKDSNHNELMDIARKFFPVVEDHHHGSHGYDAVWANGRDVWVVEIKPPGKYALSENEQKAQARWGFRYKVVQTEDDVRALAGLPQSPALQDVFREADLSSLARRLKRRG